MSRFLNKSLFVFFLCVCAGTILAQPARRSKRKPKYEPTFKYDISLRAGLGYRAEDKFDNYLSDYSSTNVPGIPNFNRYSAAHQVTQFEIMARRRYDEDSRFGFVLGSMGWNSFSVNSYNTNPFFTHLNFGMQISYLMATYHQEFKFRPVTVEAGLGIGVASANWTSSGYGYSPTAYIPQKGSLDGTGMGFRAEVFLKKWLTETFGLQLGVAVTYVWVPSFHGSINGNSGNYYLRGDGQVSTFTTSGNQDFVLKNSLFSRPLDLSTTNATLFLGAMTRFGSDSPESSPK